ncbi:hypothetical protein BDZ91DRAFT_717357, partial [Kalaharituber pfeilii]
ELAAVLEACRVALLRADRGIGKGKMYILTDSQLYVIRTALDGQCKARSRLEHELLRMSSKLADKGIEGYIIWVPAHLGIAGNERADKEAKRAVVEPGWRMQGVPGQLTVAEVRARDGAESAKDLGAKAWGLGLRHWTNKGVRAFMEISRKRVACPLCGKDKPAMRDHIMRKCRKLKRERLEEGLYGTRRNGRVVPTGFDVWFGKEEWSRTQNFCMRVAERIRPANFGKRGQG